MQTFSRGIKEALTESDEASGMHKLGPKLELLAGKVDEVWVDLWYLVPGSTGVLLAVGKAVLGQKQILILNEADSRGIRLILFFQRIEGCAFLRLQTL